MKQNHYCAFISYRHLKPDMLIAKRLHTVIETYHIPSSIKKRNGRKRMGKVFRDAEELPLSSDLGADIEEALDNSEWFIAICSPEYLQSKWCMRELEYFIERHGLNHVLAVLVSGEPADSFPKVLCYGHNSAGERVQIEPLAADVRGISVSNSIRRLNQEKLRLIAPMLSVSYDDLKRRERQRRIKFFASSVAAIMALIIGIASFVISSNRRAAVLKEEAEAQRLQAEAERTKAVNNSISEYIEKASTYLVQNERRKAADSLLNAIDISRANDNMRYDEIVTLLRRVMYIPPLTQIATLSDQNLDLSSIVVSSDKRYVLGIENGNAIVLVDLANNALKYRVSENNIEIDFIEFSPDGTLFLAVFGNGCFVQVRYVKDGSLAYTYYSEKNERGQIANAHFWKKPNTLLIQDWDSFYLLSTEGKKELFYKMGDQQDGYSYDNNLYTAFASINPYLKGYTTVESFFNPSYTDYMHMDVLLSNDMSRVLISGPRGKTGTIILDENGHRISLLDGIPGTLFEKYTFSPDASLVSCLSSNGFLATWSTESGKLLYFYSPIPESTASDYFSRISYSQDGTRMAYVYKNEIMIWEPHKGEWIASLQLDGEEKKCDSSVAFSPEGDYLAVAYESLYYLDARDAHEIKTIVGDDLTPYDTCIALGDSFVVSQRNGRTCLYSSPTISSVYYSDTLKDIELCEPFDPKVTPSNWSFIPQEHHQMNKGMMESSLQYFSDISASTFYSKDGEIAALTYPDGSIELFKREGNGEVYAYTKLFYNWPIWKTSLAISKSYLIASGGSSQLVIMRLDDLSNEKSFPGNYYERIIINDDEKLFLATGLEGYGIDVYNLETGDLLFSMGPTDKHYDSAFSVDGAYVVGKTENGFVIGDMLQDETELFALAQRLVVGHE